MTWKFEVSKGRLVDMVLDYNAFCERQFDSHVMPQQQSHMASSKYSSFSWSENSKIEVIETIFRLIWPGDTRSKDGEFWDGQDWVLWLPHVVGFLLRKVCHWQSEFPCS
jgi:hypothetical protein